MVFGDYRYRFGRAHRAKLPRMKCMISMVHIRSTCNILALGANTESFVMTE